ncbi:unnamed protein product [Adineta ricciae]|nr:unnamed protein product [Adineta ricciae]
MFGFGFYPSIYYLIIFVFIPCPLSVNIQKTRCGLTNCGYGNGLTTLWDGIFNNMIPVFSIIIFSFLLIIRVWYQKYRMRQRFQWKKYRKMTIQLLSISLIYLIFLFPPTILLCLYSSGLSYYVGADFYSASLYLSYVITLLLPIVSTFSLPEVRTKFFKLTQLSQPFKRSIVPQTITVQPVPFSRTIPNRTTRT